MRLDAISDSFKTVSVIGLGYIGLPTAAIIASRKVNVIGVDVNSKAIETINRGETHFIEPELDMVVHACVSEGYLRATNKPEPADAFLIAVPTPIKENKEPDLRFIEAAVESIAPVLKKGNLVILESTAPVGTTEQVAEWFAKLRPDLNVPLMAESPDINIAYCPERVLPGQVLHELVQNDRIIGGLTPRCAEKAARLYQLFVEGECISTSARTAEMCKLTENSFRDVNIAFANELSMICDKQNIDIWELIQLANRHPRVNILKPGPGVGGHCIAVDPWFIVSGSPTESQLIRKARDVNEYKSVWVVQKIQKTIASIELKKAEKSAEDITIACLGLAFKANIDDLRESPAVNIVKQLAKWHKGLVMVVEPHIASLPDQLDTSCELCSIEKATQEADLIVKLVDHKHFHHISNDLTLYSAYLDFTASYSE